MSHPPPNLGADTGAYKWRQNQTFVDIFIPLPVDCHVASDVRVDISSDAVSARVRGETVLDGDLYAPIKAEASTWIVADGVLEISLLKRNRRGNYENGASNADTFWYSVVREGGGAKGAARLALDAPPNDYYESEWIRDPEGGAPGYTHTGARVLGRDARVEAEVKERGANVRGRAGRRGRRERNGVDVFTSREWHPRARVACQSQGRHTRKRAREAGRRRFLGALRASPRRSRSARFEPWRRGGLGERTAWSGRARVACRTGRHGSSGRVRNCASYASARSQKRPTSVEVLVGVRARDAPPVAHRLRDRARHRGRYRDGDARRARVGRCGDVRGRGRRPRGRGPSRGNLVPRCAAYASETRWRWTNSGPSS